MYANVVNLDPDTPYEDIRRYLSEVEGGICPDTIVQNDSSSRSTPSGIENNSSSRYRLHKPALQAKRRKAGNVNPASNTEWALGARR